MTIRQEAFIRPWLVTAEEIQDPINLRLELGVNGVIRQDMSTATWIEYASAHNTLHPGDGLNRHIVWGEQDPAQEMCFSFAVRESASSKFQFGNSI